MEPKPPYHGPALPEEKLEETDLMRPLALDDDDGGEPPAPSGSQPCASGGRAALGRAPPAAAPLSAARPRRPRRAWPRAGRQQRI